MKLLLTVVVLKGHKLPLGQTRCNNQSRREAVVWRQCHHTLRRREKTYKYCLSKGAQTQEILTHTKYTIQPKTFFQKTKNISRERNFTSQQLVFFVIFRWTGVLTVLTVPSLNWFPWQRDRGWCNLSPPLTDPRPDPASTTPSGWSCEGSSHS